MDADSAYSLTLRAATAAEVGATATWPSETLIGEPESPARGIHHMLAEISERPSAAATLLKMGEAEWWLDSLRIDPEQRTAALLIEVMARVAARFRQIGDGLLRCYTPASSDLVASAARRGGFVHRMSYADMQADAAQADFWNFKVLQPQNAVLAWRYLRSSPMYRTNHFVHLGGRALFLTFERLQACLADKRLHVLGWRQADKMAGLAILDSAASAGELLMLAYLDAPDDTTLQNMLSALQGLAAGRSLAGMRWMMPLGVGLERPAARSALKHAGGMDLWLFELPLRP